MMVEMCLIGLFFFFLVFIYLFPSLLSVVTLSDSLMCWHSVRYLSLLCLTIFVSRDYHEIPSSYINVHPLSSVLRTGLGPWCASCQDHCCHHSYGPSVVAEDCY